MPRKEPNMDPAIAKELAALREEIEALRAATPSAKGAPDDEQAAPEGTPADWGDSIKDVIGTMQSALGSAENSVVVHPIAGVAAAFLAGLLIGRATKF
jgi:hypothetical protein